MAEELEIGRQRRSLDLAPEFWISCDQGSKDEVLIYAETYPLGLWAPVGSAWMARDTCFYLPNPTRLLLSQIHPHESKNRSAGYTALIPSEPVKEGLLGGCVG